MPSPVGQNIRWCFLTHPVRSKYPPMVVVGASSITATSADKIRAMVSMKYSGEMGRQSF